MKTLGKYILIASICMVSMSVAKSQELKSPNGNFSMKFSLQDEGFPAYELNFKGKQVIKPSRLGF